MTEMLVPVLVVCPYCGETIELLGDASVDDQMYVEDCGVCCRPIECRTKVEGVELTIEVSRDDD